MHFGRLFVGFAMVLLLGLTACSDREENKPIAGDLALVPASTPYVYYNQKPLPEALMERILAYVAFDLQNAIGDLERLMAEEPEMAGSLRLLLAILQELDGQLSREGLAGLGFRSDAKTLIYGLGPLPVIRTEIADPQKVRELIARIEARTGTKAPLAQHGRQSYWRFDLNELVLVMAVTDTHLILALLPAISEGEYLDDLFRTEPVPDNLQESGRLARMIEEQGFTGHGEGYLDLRSLVSVMMGRGEGVNADIWNALADPAGAPSATCGNLLLDVLEATPRLVFGTREATDRHFAVRTLLETDEAAGRLLSGLAAPVPGLGGDSDAMIAMGMGVDLPALRKLIKSAMQGVLERNRGCEWVDEEKIEQAMLQVDLLFNPMMAGIKGFYIEADGVHIDPDTTRPDAFDGQLLLAVNDPQGIYAMLGMFAPHLAQVRIPDDGTPVELPLQEVLPGLPPVYVAIGERLLGFASGETAQNSLSGLLAARAVTPSPVLAVTYDMGKLASQIGPILRPLQQRMAEEGEAESAEMIGRQIASVEAYGRSFGHVSVSVSGSAKGLVIDQRMELR